MNSLEDRVRDALKATADSLVVPEPRRRPVKTRPPFWRTPMGIVATAALATVLLIALPLILVNPGFQGSEPSSPATTPAPTTVPPSETTTVPPTTTAPPTTTSTSSGAQEAIPPLADINTSTAQFILRASGNHDVDPPTATVLLWANTPDGSTLLDEIQVGETDAFFYNTVIDVDGVCAFYASSSEPERVVVQMRLSSSLGCSQPFVYELRDNGLVVVDATAEEIGSLFVEAWRSGDEATMSSLATPEAVAAALAIAPTLAEPSLGTCEGAAGSIYCLVADAGQTTVIRLQNVDPPVTVVEVTVE